MLRLLIVLVCCLPALAQSPDSATVQGRVVDPSQAAIEGVTISVTNTVTGFQRTTRSDSSGSFAFAGLPALGGYNLEISKQGFAPLKRSISVFGGNTATLVVGCEPATIEPDLEGNFGLSRAVHEAVDEAVRLVEELVASAWTRLNAA